MLLSITVSASLGRSLLPWTIVEVNEDDYTFETLFTNIQGGRFDAVTISDELKTARLLRSLVGHKRDELMVISNGLSVLGVCREFGKFVRFSVELPSRPSLSVNVNVSVSLTVKTKALLLLPVLRDPIDFICTYTQCHCCSCSYDIIGILI